MKVKRDRLIRYAFGDISVDAAHLMVYKGDDELDLPPKAVETLIALVDRRGTIVSKDELMSAIWTDSVVEESNLSRYIYLLRSQLGAKPEGGEYIETLRRRGYRFSGNVDVREYATGRANLSPLHFAEPEREARPERLEGTYNKVARFEDWSHAHEETSASERPHTRKNSDSKPKLKSIPKGTGINKTAVFSIALLFSAAGFAALYFLWPERLVLTDQDTIIVATFDNRTGDPIFDGTLRQGLVMQLQQSPLLRILPDEQARETLKLMKRPADSPIDRSAAREICVRKGFRVFVTGSIVRLGKDYVIGLEAVASATDRPVVIEQVQAQRKEGVLEALSSAARNLRARLGEELESIEKLDVPLEVTTRSLEALRMHTLAWKELSRGKAAGAIPYFVKAIEIDPDFASAYGDLAVAYDNAGFRSEAVATITEAYGKIGNVSEVEKLNIGDLYRAYVTYDLDERVKFLEVYKSLYPRDYRPRLRLATVYLLVGDFDKSAVEARESISLGSNRSYSELGESLTALGRFAEARKALEAAERTGFKWDGFHTQLVALGTITSDPALVEQQLAALDRPEAAPEGLLMRARIRFSEGRFREGLKFYKEAAGIAENSDRNKRALNIRSEAAIHGSYFGFCKETDISGEISDYVPVQGALALASMAHAQCGEHRKAADWLNSLSAEYPEGTFQNGVVANVVRGMIALESGDANTALFHANKVPAGLERRSNFKVTILKGVALLSLHRYEEADVQFRRVIDNRGESPLSPLYGLALLGHARAVAGQGKQEFARKAYKNFFDFWDRADPDLPMMIAARKEFAALN
ncbi:MAG: winged helix-turn-helix domain-containing protein [Aridibacter famidurans]|nr:winged helix-turn-helix domain-containing protein [Aridibacter famidurans]